MVIKTCWRKLLIYYVDWTSDKLITVSLDVNWAPNHEQTWQLSHGRMRLNLGHRRFGNPTGKLRQPVQVVPR
jgi:hypothetical protein